VDSRRRLVGLFLPAFGAVVLALASPASDLRRSILIGSAAVLAVAIADAVVMSTSITRSARATFPDEQVPALPTGWYAFLRAHRARALRRPPPRVTPGGRPAARAR
jgi:drug/metabolite transporter (DMT)-like permease